MEEERLRSMTERRQRALLVFSTVLIIVVHVVEGNANDGSESILLEDRILASAAKSFAPNGTVSSGIPKAIDKNGAVFSDQEKDEAGDENQPGIEDEYEGEDERDEYAEELRAAAESHEAMSRNDKQRKNQTETETSGQSLSIIKGKENFEKEVEATKKDFDSREKSVESGSDESESSNETIVEDLESEDEEVTELIKYKNKSHFKLKDEDGGAGENAKRKRVPTVKKELSTQAEIKTTNVSKVEKRFSTKEMLDELNKQFKHSLGQTEGPWSAETTSITKESPRKIVEVLADETEADDYSDGNSPTSDKTQDNSKTADLDSEDLEEPRKLDKRQEAVLRDLETYLRAEYAAEQEQQQKLQELGAQEGALAESLLELLVKLAENPRRWERVHRLLMDVEGGLELSRQALEARKRAFNLTSVVAASTTTSPVSPTTLKKARKKPKKKKKKQRHHRFSTTTTTIPTTIPLLTTTEAPWLTTPMQWRLVAERLFGPPWPQDLQDDPGVAKVRFTAPTNSRTSPSSREFGEQLVGNKQSDDHKALNSERQALMLESSREYTQPRHLHYGKVNTHQGQTSHRESSPSSDYRGKNRDASRIRDYDPPERNSDYDMARYGQYDYPGTRIQGEEFFPVENYAQNREYRPPGREYAASKSWHDTQYKYGRPSWKSEDRGVDSGSKWTWPQLENSKANWQRVQSEREREFWPGARNENEGKVWTPQISGSENWDGVGDTDSWTKASWSVQEGRNPPWENGKTRTETSDDLNRMSLKNEAGITAPKSPVKSWNGVTSDRGKWPFKLPETKQWQKDTGGKLARKLGMEKNGAKENIQKSKTQNKNNNKGQKSSSSIPKNPGLQIEDRNRMNQMDGMNSWSTEMDTNPKIWPPKTAISPKIQSVGAWVMPVDQSTWKPYDLKSVDGFGESNEGETARQRWNVEMDTNPRTWPPKISEDQWNKFGKPSNGVTWPKWKQFAYHRVTAMPILSQGAGSLQDGSRARNNAYIAVSAVSPKYNGNQWRKNDIEETPVGQAPVNPVLQDSEHPVNQLRSAVQSPAIYTWKKDASNNRKLDQTRNHNSSDPLEEQLETLRRGTSWSHNENRDNIKKQLTVISDASETLASRFASNSSLNKPETVVSAKNDDRKAGKIEQNKEMANK